jgi:hypothetical protein
LTAFPTAKAFEMEASGRLVQGDRLESTRLGLTVRGHRPRATVPNGRGDPQGEVLNFDGQPAAAGFRPFHALRRNRIFLAAGALAPHIMPCLKANCEANDG